MQRIHLGRAVVAWAALCAPALWAAPGDVFHVDAASVAEAPDGRSWATAFPALQDGIDAAWRSFGGEVWVAGGAYGEVRANDGALQLRFAVAVYGGFAGDETARNQRDPLANETAIDGAAADAGEPAGTVVLGADNALLDGFTIRGGRGEFGAGLLNVDASPTLRNCLFIDNAAERFGGGAINVGTATAVFEDCVFNNNRAGESGGAVANTGASPAFTGCRFEGNAAGGAGGAMFNTPGSNPSISACLFVDNTAVVGGGAIFNEESSPLIERSRFLRNRCQQFGGALFNNSGARPLLINCLFLGNVADDEGDSGLSASQIRGGAIANVDSVSTAINCTFSRNTARGAGGALFNTGQSPALINCILWDNAPGEVSNINSFPAFRNCNVEGGVGGATNFSAEPRFVDPEDFEDGYLIRPESPCIDRGAADVAPGIDIAGTTRPRGRGIDVGAYESLRIGIPDPFSCEGVTITLGKDAAPAAAGDWVVQGGLVLAMALTAIRYRRR